jgi:hypothetical protein
MDRQTSRRKAWILDISSLFCGKQENLDRLATHPPFPLELCSVNPKSKMVFPRRLPDRIPVYGYNLRGYGLSKQLQVLFARRLEKTSASFTTLRVAPDYTGVSSHILNTNNDGRNNIVLQQVLITNLQFRWNCFGSTFVI